MSTHSCLRIGERLLCGDQIISALIEYKIFDLLIGQVILDDVLENVYLSDQEIYTALAGSTGMSIPADIEGFLSQWCQEHDVSWDYLNRVILRDLRVEKFKHLYFDRQVESEFLRIKPELDQVEYARIQVNDFFLAQELYFQIQDDGAEFAQLAREHSLGHERHTSGWMEPVSLTDLPLEVTNLFRTGQLGTVYGPIAVADLFWVVRLERVSPARLTEATRSMIIERLYRRWLQAQVKALTTQSGAIALQDEPQILPVSL
jgi:hypothetical protein